MSVWQNVEKLTKGEELCWKEISKVQKIDWLSAVRMEQTQKKFMKCAVTGLVGTKVNPANSE